MTLKACPKCQLESVLKTKRTYGEKLYKVACSDKRCIEQKEWATNKTIVINDWNHRHMPRCGTCRFWENITGRCQDDAGTFYYMVLLETDGCIHHEPREEG